MAEPTDEQLKSYADKLPEVYRTALGAFLQRYEDGTAVRRAETPVKLSWIRSEVHEIHPAYHEPDVKALLNQLVQRNFLQECGSPTGIEKYAMDQFRRYVPTALGERLIAAVTGVEPVPELIPALPEPVWT